MGLSAFWGLRNHHGFLLLFVLPLDVAKLTIQQLPPCVSACDCLVKVVSFPGFWSVRRPLSAGRRRPGPCVCVSVCVKLGCEVLARAELCVEGTHPVSSPFKSYKGLMTSGFQCIWPQRVFCPKSRGSMGVFYRTGSLSRHAHFTPPMSSNLKRSTAGS